MDATTLFVTCVVTVVALVVFCIVVGIVMSKNPRGRTNDRK